MNRNARLVAEAEGELAREARIELYAVQAAGAGGEMLGDGSVSRSDLDDGAVAYVSQSVCDAETGGVVYEEILAELGFLWHCR